MVYALAIVGGVVAYVVGSLLMRWVDGRALFDHRDWRTL